MPVLSVVWLGLRVSASGEGLVLVGGAAAARGGASVAATGLDHHVAVFAQDDIVAAVIVEYRGGTQFGGRTARLGDSIWLHQVHLAREEVARRGVSTVDFSQARPAPAPSSHLPQVSSCSPLPCSIDLQPRLTLLDPCPSLPRGP